MRNIIALFLAFVVLGGAFAFGYRLAPPQPEMWVTVDPATPATMSFEQQIRAQAMPTVRPLKGPNGVCSAVVISTGYAVTALHCEEAGDAKVDGHPVAKWHKFSAKDIALVEVPGLLCPCATLGKQALVGERVAAVGFPYGVGSVVTYGEAQGDVIYKDERYMHHTAYTMPAMSGGGVFAVRNRRVVLLATTSKAADTSALSVTVEGVPIRPAEIERP